MSTSTPNITLIAPPVRAGHARPDGRPDRWRTPRALSRLLAPAERDAILVARSGAVDLLRTLQADRDLIQDRLTSVGRIDPMKSVRGESSLERAIETTEEMIAAYDAILFQDHPPVVGRRVG